MTLDEMLKCAFFAEMVMWYRSKSNFLHSPCWMDEWALGYFCSLRDAAIINHNQWAFLCDAFQPKEIE